MQNPSGLHQSAPAPALRPTELGEPNEGKHSYGEDFQLAEVARGQPSGGAGAFGDDRLSRRFVWVNMKAGMLQPDPMRVYLVVPYSEKDEARRLGAQWDPVVKRWWIGRHDIATSPAIHRWITDNGPLAARAKDALAFTESETRRAARRPKQGKLASTRRTDFNLPTCDCLTPAWEDCEHTDPTTTVAL